MPSRLIIHAPNIHTGGGRSLLIAILAGLPKDLYAILIADERLPIDEKMSPKLRIERVPATLLGRIGAERWLARNASNGDTVLAFGNLPPLFSLRARVIVFLQNRYLVDKIDLAGFPLTSRIRLTLERYWFASRISNADEIIVQTRSMKNLVISGLGEKYRISVFPFAGKTPRPLDKTASDNKSGRKRYDFVYVASGEPHKNHRRLVEAWCLLAAENHYPSLLLTLDKSRFAALREWIEEQTGQFGLKIDNVDKLDNGKLGEFYSEAAALIFPSTLESFGLPLVEARSQGLAVLASELDYVRDVLDPDQSFDPQSSTSIARAVKRHLGCDGAQLKIRDADDFVEYVCSRR